MLFLFVCLFVDREKHFEDVMEVGLEWPRQKGLEPRQPRWAPVNADICRGCLGQ